MRLELWSRQHPWSSALIGLVTFLMLWSVLVVRTSQRVYVSPAVVDDSPTLVAKTGHLLPLPDRHVPFSIEKRNGRYTFVLRNK